MGLRDLLSRAGAAAQGLAAKVASKDLQGLGEKFGEKADAALATAQQKGGEFLAKVESGEVAAQIEEKLDTAKRRIGEALGGGQKPPAP